MTYSKKIINHSTTVLNALIYFYFSNFGVIRDNKFQILLFQRTAQVLHIVEELISVNHQTIQPLIYLCSCFGSILCWGLIFNQPLNHQTTNYNFCIQEGDEFWSTTRPLNHQSGFVTVQDLTCVGVSFSINHSTTRPQTTNYNFCIDGGG